MLDAVRLGLERGEEAAQVGAELAQPQLELTQLLARARELGREPLERRERALGGGGQRHVAPSPSSGASASAAACAPSASSVT